MTTQTPPQKSRWQEITSIWKKEQWLYGLVGTLAGFIFGIAVSGHLGNLVRWFAGGFWNEALSIAITILILDRLSDNRTRQFHKSIAQMQELTALRGSKNTDHIQAIITLMKQNDLLNNADLRWLSLERVSLWDANLENARLWNTNLTEAQLVEANLQGSNLREANLKRALLGGSNCQNTDLGKADLQDAHLEGVNLRGAILQDANLCGVSFGKFTNNTIENETMFSEKTILPDDKYWTPETDMTRYTDPNHPDFWEPEWVKKQRENE